MSRSRRVVNAISDFVLLSNGRHQVLPQRMLNLTNQVIFGDLNEGETKLQCIYTYRLSNRVIVTTGSHQHTTHTFQTVGRRPELLRSIGLRISDDFYFVRPVCFLSFSISSRYRGSALAFARRGEYITNMVIIACSSRALFTYWKYESRSPSA